MIKKEDLIKISRDKDYIRSQKHGDSLQTFLDHYPDGAPDSIICKVLCITQKELDDIYASAIKKLQMGMENND